MENQYEAIIRAFKVLGGKRTIVEINGWIISNYGPRWKDIGTSMADMVSPKYGGNPSSCVSENLRILRRVSRGVYCLVEEDELPKWKTSKGSQFQLRKYVNNHGNLLNKAIFSSSTSLLSFVRGELDIEWRSPLTEDGYKEYQDDFLTLYFDNDLDSTEALNVIRKYWPKNGPVWDGIGIVKGLKQRGLVLVEAKAHRRETYSKIKATSDDSISKITDTIKLTQHEFHSHSSNGPWLEEYYQLSNRLAFLHILNDKLNIPTWLVLVNFIGDKTHIETSEEEWLSHYQGVFETLDINHDSKLLSNVGMVYLPGISIERGECTMNESQFLAVCKDRLDDPNGFVYTVYFVNNSDQEIESVSYQTGGFTTFYDEIVQTSTHEKSLGRVLPYSAVEVETDDEGAFEFSIHFDFQLKLNSGQVEEKHFQIGKYFNYGTSPTESLPVLKKSGYAFYSK